jgi:hypothetical protein
MRSSLMPQVLVPLVSVPLLAVLHHALAIRVIVWAMSSSMGDEGTSSGLLTAVAVFLSWPGDLFISSPGQRMEYGWIVSWVNSLIWGAGLTVAGWAVRLLKARHVIP